jgi:hypothetical protein
MIVLGDIVRDLQHANLIRLSYYFSYWVDFWFIIYYLLLWIPPAVFTPFCMGGENTESSTAKSEKKSEKKECTWLKNFKEYANPSLALWFTLLYNVFSFILLLTYGTQWNALSKFIIMTVLIKVLPLYLLRDHKIRLWNDLYVFLAYYFAYFFYMFVIVKVNPIRIYTDGLMSITKGKHHTPFFALIYYLFKV